MATTIRWVAVKNICPLFTLQNVNEHMYYEAQVFLLSHFVKVKKKVWESILPGISNMLFQ